ncbi:MAG: hypothetical protein AB7F86_15090 [Bdellovibrionales bacterium]
MKKVLICLLVSLGMASIAQAESVGQSSTSVKETKDIGGYVSIGNPFPSLLGLNAAYNLDQNWRASAGYGEVEVTTSMTFSNEGITSEKIKAQTYGLGMEYLFLDTQVRPIVGLHAGYFSVSGKGKISIQGIEKSTGLAYSNLGLDWTTGGGFNMGTGVNVAFLGGSGANFYANVGYFF